MYIEMGAIDLPDAMPDRFALEMAAKKFTTWITGAEAQQLIKDFKLLGKPLFTPNAK